MPLLPNESWNLNESTSIFEDRPQISASFSVNGDHSPHTDDRFIHKFMHVKYVHTKCSLRGFCVREGVSLTSLSFIPIMFLGA